MRKALLFTLLSITIIFSSTVFSQCVDEKKSINVPSQYKTITDAINATKSIEYKNQKVTIFVDYDIYNEKGKGILIDRKCLDIIGIPNEKGEKPIIQRKKFEGYEQAVVKIRESNIKFEGFDIDADERCNAYGILVLIANFDKDITQDLTDIFIEKNTIRDIGQSGCSQAHGIVVWSDRVVETIDTEGNNPFFKKEDINKSIWIKNIKISNNLLYNLRLGSSETITIKHNVSDFQVTQNTIFNTDNIGIDVVGFEKNDLQAQKGQITGNNISDLRSGNAAYPWVAGIYVDGGKEVLISENKISSFGFGIEIASEHYKKSVSGIEVKNNLIYENKVAGIGIGHGRNEGDDQRSYVFDCKIFNNFIRDNGIESYKEGEFYDKGQIHLISHIAGGLRNISIYDNNICISNGKNIFRHIYWENYIWKSDDMKEVNKEKLEISFNNNSFFGSIDNKAWYLNGSNTSITKAFLGNYFKEFNVNNILENSCK